MTWDELTKILKSYTKLKIANKSVLLKVQQMERELSSAKGMFHEGEPVSGGQKISRTERFAVMLDAKDKYEEQANYIECLGLKIENLIKSLYTNNESVDPKDWEKMQNAELVMFNYFINSMTVYDVMVWMNYSKSQVLRIVQFGKKYLYEQVKNIEYKDFMKIDEKDYKMRLHATLRDDTIIS